MQSIAVLSPLLINQIAAGEVIERPASVVKELIENSIDAGASRIDIAIELGGRELIQVIDDGHGIPPDQLHLAIMPHATSKISETHDLDAIATLGFRGEALASIVSISRMSIISRPGNQESAYKIDSEGDKIGEPQPCAGKVGTTIAIRNLFFNTPARRKFLRTVRTEFNHITELTQKQALSHPRIGFTLKHDGKLSSNLDLPPDQTPRQRVLSILGQELANELYEVNITEGMYSTGGRAVTAGCSLWGLIGSPAIARGTAKAQHIFLNGRAIKDKTISHAIKEAYRGLVDPSRFPTVVLYIELNPSMVDVNVHPAKSEVRFHDTQMIHGLILSSLRERLLASDITRAVGMGGNYNTSKPYNNTPPYTNATSTDNIINPGQQNKNNYTGGVPQTGYTSAGSSNSSHTTSFKNRFLQPGPAVNTQQGFTFREARDSIASDSQSEMNKPNLNTDPDNYNEFDTADNHKQELNTSDNQAVNSYSGLPKILQIHNSYMVLEDENGILIIDQHALHERVMFEKLKARILVGNLESQRLLLPVVINNIEPTYYDLLEQTKNLFIRIGIEAELIGPDALAVQAFPSFLFERNVEPGEFVLSLLDYAAEHGALQGEITEDEAALHKVLDMMSCKAAVKAGDKLSESELMELLKYQHNFERTGSCPHGRPTTIHLSLQELEKQFERR